MLHFCNQAIESTLGFGQRPTRLGVHHQSAHLQPSERFIFEHRCLFFRHRRFLSAPGRCLVLFKSSRSLSSGPNLQSQHQRGKRFHAILRRAIFPFQVLQFHLLISQPGLTLTRMSDDRQGLRTDAAKNVQIPQSRSMAPYQQGDMMQSPAFGRCLERLCFRPGPSRLLNFAYSRMRK